MRKLTRKSYRRKRILLGVALFVSVALIATGFGAWVLSTDTSASQNGNVSVGTVTDSSLSIVLNQAQHTVSFDAAKDDANGRLQWDGENSENLSFVVAGTVEGVDFCKSLTIELVIEDEEEKARIDAAIAANFIVAPECYGKAVSIYEILAVNPAVDGATVKDYFEYTVEFEWGSAFGGENPSTYFDGAGSSIKDADMEKSLGDFYKLVYGATDYKTGADVANLGTAPKFKVVVSASASVQSGNN